MFFGVAESYIFGVAPEARYKHGVMFLQSCFLSLLSGAKEVHIQAVIQMGKRPELSTSIPHLINVVLRSNAERELL